LCLIRLDPIPSTDRITEFQEDALVREALNKVIAMLVSENLSRRGVSEKKVFFHEVMKGADLFLPCATKQGVDLREYAKQVEKDLEEVEHLHVMDCKSLSESVSTWIALTFC
jgi:Tfp pilus assembly pilus retraction ATPase PilT